MTFDDDIDAYKYDRALREVDQAALVDAAFREILAGNFDSFAVLECQRIGLLRLVGVRG